MSWLKNRRKKKLLCDGTYFVFRGMVYRVTDRDIFYVIAVNEFGGYHTFYYKALPDSLIVWNDKESAQKIARLVNLRLNAELNKHREELGGNIMDLEFIQLILTTCLKCVVLQANLIDGLVQETYTKEELNTHLDRLEYLKFQLESFNEELGEEEDA